MICGRMGRIDLLSFPTVLLLSPGPAAGSIFIPGTTRLGSPPPPRWTMSQTLEDSMNRKSIVHRAFTLIELLVVITIVAVLAALLMPALGTAKERANTAACAGNLQRTGTGFATYLNDHNGFYPYISSECIPIIDYSLAPCTCDATYLAGISATPAQSPYCNTPSHINWDPSCPALPCWNGGFISSACCANHWVYQLAGYFGDGAVN